MKSPGENKVFKALQNTAVMQEALHKAVQTALWRHKRLGNPICIWQDGKVVWIPPEEIDVPEPETKDLSGPEHD